MAEQVDGDSFRAFVERISAEGGTQEEIRAQYAAGPGDLEAVLAGLDEADLDLARAPGK